MNLNKGFPLMSLYVIFCDCRYMCRYICLIPPLSCFYELPIRPALLCRNDHFRSPFCPDLHLLTLVYSTFLYNLMHCPAFPFSPLQCYTVPSLLPLIVISHPQHEKHTLVVGKDCNLTSISAHNSEQGIMPSDYCHKADSVLGAGTGCTVGCR